MYTLHGLRRFLQSNADFSLNAYREALSDAVTNLEESYKEKGELAELLYREVERNMRNSKELKSVRVMALKKGSPAFHMMGNIGRDILDVEYIYVNTESDDYYMGSFIEGLGFINVIFRKEDVRPLTKGEIDEQNKKILTINGGYAGSFNLDYDGFYKGK